MLAAVLATAMPLVATAPPTERRLHSNDVDASSFLWNDWNRFVENYHPNDVADDDPATAWVEGSKTSGAGEQLRIRVTQLPDTTRVRLRIRNGYQNSKPLFLANARAREVTLWLLPSEVEVRATLTDRDAWQELAITQPRGPMRAVELDIVPAGDIHRPLALRVWRSLDPDLLTEVFLGRRFEDVDGGGKTTVWDSSSAPGQTRRHELPVALFGGEPDEALDLELVYVFIQSESPRPHRLPAEPTTHMMARRRPRIDELPACAP